MTNYLGYDWQYRIAGSCARFALRHALLCLGIPTTEDALTDALGVGRFAGALGIGEEPIIKGIRSFDCEAVELEDDFASRTRQVISELIQEGTPCVISVDDAEHWAVVVGRNGSDFIWIDSADDELVGTCTWAELSAWMAMSPETAAYRYYLIGVRPKEESWLAQSLVHNFAKVRGHLDSSDIRVNWGNRLALLNDHLYAAPDEGMSAKTFFENHAPAILDAALLGAEHEREAMALELSGLRTVAIAHRLRVAQNDVVAAAAGIAVGIAAQH